MKRRKFLQMAFRTGAVAMADAAMPAILRGAAAPEPYGATMLETTDKTAFTQSMLEQIELAGLPAPAVYIPFPLININGETDPEKRIVFGADADFMKRISGAKYFLTRSYTDERPCSSVALADQGEALRIFVALHETVHYAIYYAQKNGMSLSDYAYKKVNNVPATQSAQDFRDALRRERNDQSVLYDMFHPSDAKALNDRILVSSLTSINLNERISDAAAAIYVLSNYGDNPVNRKFLRDVMDFRQSLYPDDQHDTASSIQAAMDAFSKNGRRGINLIEAARMATDIVVAQPEFTKSVPHIAEDIHARRALTQDYLGASPGWHIFEKSYADEKKQGGLIDQLAKARNRACTLTPP